MFYRLRRKLSGRKFKRYIFTLTFMFAIFVMSLGYAALSQYMEIEGMAIVQRVWNVYVSEITPTSTNGGSWLYQNETYQNVVSLQTTLPNLNSTVTYTITLVNSGNVKGILHSLDKIEDKNTNITYTISGVSVGTTIAAGETVTAIVTVQYKEGATSISTEPKKIMIGFQFVEDTSSSGGSSGGSTAVTLSSKILSDNTAQSDSGLEFKYSSEGCYRENGEDVCNAAKATNGLYYTSTNTENNKTTYYFRGAVTNNYVRFADFYWKIIRINEDGSIRLIYNGTSATATGSSVGIGTKQFNSDSVDNAYVGYMYGTPGSSSYASTHANTNSSIVKGVLDTWYETNLKMDYGSYIADAGFCNDRSIASRSRLWDSNDTARGYGTNKTYYGAYNRLVNNVKPQFACPNASNDLFTTSSSSKGNKALTNPIGLITADEVWYAGGISYTNNSTYYLYANYQYWTMSPEYFNGSYAYDYFMYQYGDLTPVVSTSSNRGVRPVINLKSTVTLSSTNPSGCSSQNGSASCPYIIDTGSSTTSYTVSVSSTNTNYGTVSPSSKTVASGSSAAFTLSPKSGYAYSSNTCGGTVSGNTMTISNVTANKTCTVTFKQSSTGTTLSSRILSDNTVQSDSGIDFSKISSDTNGKGLYYTSTNTENNQKTYYFRGNVTNNNVQFGKDSNGNKLYWKIIRINEDGSIRLIHNGTTTGQGDDKIDNGYGPFNINIDDNAYLGYMYGTVNVTNYDYSLTHTNTNDSSIKGALDTWYISNLSTYSSYLADAGFCNDRSIEYTATSGAGDDPTEYDAFVRLDKTFATVVVGTQFGPQFKCSQTNDLFTTSTSSKGNKALKYPIGLITADEVAYAGGVLGVANSSYYLYAIEGNAGVGDGLGEFWTMTPRGYYDPNYGSKNYAYMYMVGNDGSIYSDVAYNLAGGFRPVINLKSTVTLSSTNPSGCSSQNGSASCPYVVG